MSSRSRTVQPPSHRRNSSSGSGSKKLSSIVTFPLNAPGRRTTRGLHATSRATGWPFAGNDDLVARLDLRQQAGQVGLRFVDVHRCHFRILGYLGRLID